MSDTDAHTRKPTINATKLKKVRTKLGWPIPYLATRSGVSRSYLNEIELGSKLYPSDRVIEAIAESMGVKEQEIRWP